VQFTEAAAALQLTAKEVVGMVIVSLQTVTLIPELVRDGFCIAFSQGLPLLDFVLYVVVEDSM
tara:strand:+ start:921 stop:1109 length:189 start_codon:yes stop_codon:yes gene_type:complete